MLHFASDMADDVKKTQMEDASDAGSAPAEPGWKPWKSLVGIKGQLSLLISDAYCFRGAR